LNSSEERADEQGATTSSVAAATAAPLPKLSHSERNVLKTMFAVVVCFTVCSSGESILIILMVSRNLCPVNSMLNNWLSVKRTYPSLDSGLTDLFHNQSFSCWKVTKPQLVTPYWKLGYSVIDI